MEETKDFKIDILYCLLIEKFSNGRMYNIIFVGKCKYTSLENEPYE